MMKSRISNAQERLDISLFETDSLLPEYEDSNSAEDIFNIETVRGKLSAIDWAFTKEDTTYLSHDIHPYPAKFIPQIPGNLIACLSLRGELVMDPFGGSGTTALEAVRLGRRAVSVDANPVAVLTGRVKTSRLDSASLRDIHSIRSLLLSYLEENAIPTASLLSKYAQYIPDIHNRQKWFPDTSCAELALIRAHIARLETQPGRDLATLAMSRIVLKVSYQDSETRYTSRKRDIHAGETIRLYLKVLDTVVRDVRSTASLVQYGVAEFILADTRTLDPKKISSESVDLIVTSPPYGNATDYHLYHRFRLYWIGADPKELGRVEIGSHLRHQRESTGFEAFRDELQEALRQMFRILRPHRYAAIVLGDSIYEGKRYGGREVVEALAKDVGFENVQILERTIHATKRSFTVAGRRATTEVIAILRKPGHKCRVCLEPPPYNLWDYETVLRRREIATFLNKSPSDIPAKGDIEVTSLQFTKLRRLTFSHGLLLESRKSEPTWQAIVENGHAALPSSRKDPKYVTHGLHAYKGKFYPQLAKSLINIAGHEPGTRVFDPFCGSGTTLLESYLNGHAAYGCDMNPIAALVARAKVGILEVDPAVVTEAVRTLREKISSHTTIFPKVKDEFLPGTLTEIVSWFPEPVIYKLNWLLKAIRSLSTGVLRDYMESLVSSIIREVSQQDPGDLRIRRREKPLEDADVIGLFSSALDQQYVRLERFWSRRGYCPYRFHRATVVEGDSRSPETIRHLGLTPESVDLVLTSPPYATALPYIDTDRLSILVLGGMDAATRRPLEQNLTGSREITQSEKSKFETQLSDHKSLNLPKRLTSFLIDLHRRMQSAGVGFRRGNMPALLLRFFIDMRDVLNNVRKVMKSGADAMVIMGDNFTSTGSDQIHIPTTQFVADIGECVGLEVVEKIPITVTTENMVHVKNAIKQNAVIRFRRT